MKGITITRIRPGRRASGGAGRAKAIVALGLTAGAGLSILLVTTGHAARAAIAAGTPRAAPSRTASAIGRLAASSSRPDAASPAVSITASISAPISTSPAAPLPVAALPGNAAIAWSPVGHVRSRAVAGHEVSLNECARVQGSVLWTQQGYISADRKYPAVQDTFTFTSPTNAQTAYRAILSAMAMCQQTSQGLEAKSGSAVDAVVSQTAKTPFATAWARRWTGVAGMSAGGPQINHLYLVEHGSSVIALQFSELSPKTGAGSYDTAGDPLTLAAIGSALTK